MSRLLKYMHDALFSDDLLLRVFIFMTGALLLMIPVLAAVFGHLAAGADPALYIWVGFFAVLALSLIYASLFGGARLMKYASVWAVPGELAIFLGLITFAIPITLVIRLFRPTRKNP